MLGTPRFPARILLLSTALLFPGPVFTQFTTTLQPQTVAQFDEYAKTVEQQLNNRWNGSAPFLSLDESTDEKATVMAGQLWIRPGVAGNPVSIDHGLIHDWVGTVFLPNTNLRNVLAVLQDFDRHSQNYPEVILSRMLSRHGNDIVGYWRLQRTSGAITVVLDVHQVAHWKKIGPDKWVCTAYAKDISEVEHPGTPDEKALPPGKGQGYLWRMYAYWSLENAATGVLAESRTLSLSRNIPGILSSIIEPFVSKIPSQSLESMLEHTRRAISNR